MGQRLSPPREVLAIADRLERAGHETWCVGGAIRDALLGHPGLDWDLATAARPSEVQRLFRRTVPVGIEFGTVGVLDDGGRLHEVTTFRRDVRTDGRHAEVEFGSSLEDDLARRDFTINAIAYSPSRGEIRDPFDGRADLERRIVRAVGDPRERMREDRLRALRALRFAARFDFEIEGATWSAIAESGPQLGQLSAERVKQELEKTMDQVPRPARALRWWRSSGALETLVPALAAINDLTLASIDCLPAPGLPNRPQRRTNRLAALFADLDEPTATRTLRALKFSNADVAWMAAVAAGAGTARTALEPAFAGGKSPGDGVLRGVVSRVGRLRAGPVVRVLAARWAAMREAGVAAPSESAIRSLHRRMTRIAFHDPIEVGDLAIDGEDLRTAGIPPGPEMGKILRALLDVVIEDPSQNVAMTLLARARSLRAGE